MAETKDEKWIKKSWNDYSFDCDTLGIIFVLDDGNFLYATLSEEYKYSGKGHMDIFEYCVKNVLKVSIPLSDDQMEYAWNLALSHNIMTIQITSVDEEIVVLNSNSPDEQLNVLEKIVDYLGEKEMKFSADICCENNRFSVINDNYKSSQEYGLEKNEFKSRLKSSLNNLKNGNSK